MTAGGALQVLWVAAYSGLLLASMLTDIRWLRIPNLISLLLVALFLAVAVPTWLSGHPVNWASHLLAGGIVLVVGIGLLAWGKIGGGDVKAAASPNGAASSGIPPRPWPCSTASSSAGCGRSPKHQSAQPAIA